MRGYGAIAVAAFALLCGRPAGAVDAPPDTIGIEEIHRGQRGYGLSVFAGTEPVRFEVEVLGVVQNLSPNTSFIMAKLSGQELEESGVIAGMSGSPVFIDGRLAGAVAFGWNFSREPIAGITPIALMREMGATSADFPPLGMGVAALAPAPPLTFAQVVTQDLPPDYLATRLTTLRPNLPAGAAPAFQWVGSGFGASSLDLLSKALGGVTSGGGAVPPAGSEILQPGQMLAAVVVDGDLRLAATGTVTDRTGDTLLAFGHQFLGSGPVRIPMAPAEVITVIKSLNSSFKLCNFGDVVGAFTQDRRVGLEAHLGLDAPMAPVTVRVRGERDQTYRMRVAQIPGITSMMIGTALIGSLEVAAWRTGPQGVDLTGTLRLEGQPPLELRQSFDGESAATQIASYIMSTVSYLLDGSFPEPRLEGLEVELKHHPRERTATLLGAFAERTTVAPGESVRVFLEVETFRGPRMRQAIEVAIPADTPAGRVSLHVGDGASIDGLRLGLEPSEPESLDEALKLLNGLSSRLDLATLLTVAERGMSVDGDALARLPGSMRSVFGAPGSAASSLRSAILARQVVRVGSPLAGTARVELTIEPNERAQAARVKQGKGAPR